MDYFVMVKNFQRVEMKNRFILYESGFQRGQRLEPNMDAELQTFVAIFV